MHAQLQSLADRVVFDSATVLYLASGVGRDQADARAEPGGWTVRQVLGHVGSALIGYAAAVQRVAAGEPLVPDGWDPAVLNAERAARDANLAIDEAAQRIRDGRREFLDALNQIADADLDRAFRGEPVAATLGTWSRHCASHAFDLLEALPQFRVDPIAVNWALFLESGGDSRLVERQQRLFREIEARLPRERKEA